MYCQIKFFSKVFHFCPEKMSLFFIERNAEQDMLFGADCHYKDIMDM